VAADGTCPVLEETKPCNKHACKKCKEGEQVPIYWSEHGNTAGHNHIKHTFNVVNSDGLTRLGADYSGTLEGTYDLGKDGPWKISFHYQTSEVHFPTSHRDSLSVDVNDGAFQVSHANDLPSASNQELYFMTDKSSLNYNIKWTSTTDVETGHMGIFNGVATCTHTTPPTPAPWSDICSHVTCSRITDSEAKPHKVKRWVDGTVVNYDTNRFTIQHHKRELAGTHAQCGYLDYKRPDQCICVCRHGMHHFHIPKPPKIAAKKVDEPTASDVESEHLFQQEMTGNGIGETIQSDFIDTMGNDELEADLPPPGAQAESDLPPLPED
jgi:hypothetical protein